MFILVVMKLCLLSPSPALPAAVSSLISHQFDNHILSVHTHIMDFSHLNGRPQLLDHLGNPIKRDGDARPGGISVPHSWTFVAKLTSGDYGYWHDRFDEALRHSRRDAEVMRRDAILMGMLQERYLAVSSLP